ncbi:MAG: hypothetical protein JW741_17395 [Sedimentisphaerales bacterium]|nr:hypothetical protein [Sedimentisphaerales bacterium]
MNVRRYSVVNVVATGVLVLILVCLGLFWARWFCELGRQFLLAEAIDSPQVLPSHLFPSELEGEPNVVSPSRVEAHLRVEEGCAQSLGLVQYMQNRLMEEPGSHVYSWDRDPDGARVYWDRSLGLIVYRDTRRMSQSDGTYVTQKITLYAGPDGMAEEPDESLGRFADPLASKETNRPWIVYDRSLRRFFGINWLRKAVRKGPQFPEDASNRPVQIGRLSKNDSCVWVNLREPMIEDLPKSPPPSEADANTPDEGSAEMASIYGPEYMKLFSDVGSSTVRLVPLIQTYSYGFDTKKTFVLDASGRIDLLDRDTLEIVGRAGVLPVPETLFPHKARDPVAPADVFAYDFRPVYVAEDRTYVGCGVATVSRDATAMTLHVFDPNGRRVGTGSTTCGYAERRRGWGSARAAYLHLPGARLLTGLKYLLENMHPPVLLFLSHFTASRIEAAAGHRGVFVLPNSFVAMASRNMRYGPVRRFLEALPFLMLSVGLAGIFAGQVACDCTRLGISRKERLWWIVATMLFGLPVALTYRLTRPRTTQVTCRNCGRPRRPDMEKCHRCASAWEVPELTPPAWRVLDGGRAEEEIVPVEAEPESEPAS